MSRCKCRPKFIKCCPQIKREKEECHCDHFAKEQAGVFIVDTVTPAAPPTSAVTGVTFVKVSGDGRVINATVAGPTQIQATNRYIYTVNVFVEFDKPFRHIPAVVTDLDSSSGNIYAPGVGVVNSAIDVNQVTTNGFILRVHVIIEDFTGAPPAGANILFRQLLQPTNTRALGFSFIAKAGNNDHKEHHYNGNF